MIITVILGIGFMAMQATEYYYSTFTIADSVFGSAFFLTTGLHGAHVLVGVIFLMERKQKCNESYIQI